MYRLQRCDARLAQPLGPEQVLDRRRDVLAAIRTMFTWAVQRDLLAASPVAGIKAPGKETERERVLADDEIVKVWTAAAKMGGVSGALIQCLILTAQHRDEVATMRWADLDLEARVWTLPREATKGDRSHQVPLSPLVIEILTALPRTGGVRLRVPEGRPADFRI